MFEKFTDKAIKSIMLAQEESRRLRHNFVGTEQLLVGLLAEGTGNAAKALKSFGLTLRVVRAEVEKIIGQGSGFIAIDIPFTPRAKNVLHGALEEARKLNRDTIDTEHLLLALLRDEESIAIRILAALNIDTSILAQTVVAYSKQNPGAGSRAGSVKTPTLDQFGVDLTERARAGQIDPVIGRTAELNRTIQILGRRTKNNPILIGEPGVGKTAVAEGLALKIATGEVPEELKNKRIVTLEMSSMVAGTKYRGEFEERMKKLLDELRGSNEVILVIDEIHTLIGAGSSEGSVDAANILKPALGRGEIRVIGATTLDEYRKHFEKDAALNRRFQPVMIDEPSVEDTVQILFGLRKAYEEHHKLSISDDALIAAAKMSDRYISDRFLPDKAIDLVDEAASRVKFHRAGEEDVVVTEEDIAEVLAAWTGIPAQKLSENETERLINMEDVLHKRVIGQHDAIVAISRAIRRARVGLKNPKRPIGSFIFAGPTGVGKTELAKTLAEYFFGKADSLIRVDMSEYMEKHAISRMIGSPPGYVGHDEPGQLTEAVRRRPYSVVLFDEIEKAHPDAFNIMLQILEDGHLTDSKGRKVDFKNTIIILTSNIGARSIDKGSSFGFTSSPDAAYKSMKDRVMDDMKQAFRPEFLNRLDEIIVFHPLTKPEVRQIADIMLTEVSTRLKENGFDLVVTEAVKDKLAEEGYSPAYGARPLRRVIQRQIEDSLAEEILSGRVTTDKPIVVDLDEEGTVVFVQTAPSATA